eukprot:Phypoly_transcript_04355.p1 GENE.Phypoly_transcript_04355~~Phypoly_transcript_04355.p1  ORF type:complete len:653 (+),score=116.59 Phypoly_transcript_04355:79-1959(+)
MTNVRQCAASIATCTNRLVTVAQQVSASSTNETLQNEMVNAINGITDSMQILVSEFMNIIKTRGEKEKEAFSAAASALGEAINLVVSLADETSRDELTSAIKSAATAARNLYDSTGGSQREYQESTEVFSEMSIRLLDVANLTSETTLVPDKRKLLLSAVSQLEQSNVQFQTAAARAYESHDAPEDAQNLSNALQNVTEGYKIIAEAAKMKAPSLLIALDPHEDIIGKKIGEIGRLLEYAANQVYNSARNGKLDELVEAAQNVAKFTLQVMHHAEETVNSVNDAHKTELRTFIEALWEHSNSLVDVAGAVSGQMPSPPKELISDLGIKRDELIIVVRKLLACERKPSTAIPAPVKRQSVLEEENKAALFRLAKEEVATAMHIADEAERISKNIGDAQKRTEVLSSVTDLRRGGEKVLRAAKAAAASPNEHAALGAAQKELGGHVRRVFELVCAESEEVKLSLRAIDTALTDDGGGVGLGNKVFEAAKVVLDEISGFPQEQDGHVVDAKDVLVKAKAICAKSATLVTELKEFSRETRAQDLKDVLGTAAKLLNDRGIRIKIISIVKLASGHGNDEVGMAVAGLAQEINNVVNSLKGELLRLKLDTAVKQVTAMKSALGVLKTHGRKF